VAGVVLGLVLGAGGFALISAIWHHGPGGGRGDDRGHFRQDDRPGRLPDRMPGR